MISVLYVDDEPELLELCRVFLEETGDFRVETLQDPNLVPAVLEKNRYDAIICDYHMPGTDGISVLKMVRKTAGCIPFILFTGRGREEVVIEALNNGADFYLQKGGDAQAQFAELTSKIRQAVTRREAESSLRESQKLLTDIINFLPDATLAIDRSGKIIAWNRAIEAMTGVPASEMLGKGDHEYAIPFYGCRRPILIDLIFEKDEVIRDKYSGIIREKDALIAETCLPRPMGVSRVLLGKASPLYNPQGEITGAIESIRDITPQRRVDDELRAAYEQITANDEELRQQFNELAHAEGDIRKKEQQLREITSTIPGVVFQFYARGESEFGFYYLSEQVREIFGGENETTASYFGYFTAHVHPEDRRALLESIRDAVKRADRWQYEGRFVRETGEIVWFKGISRPVRQGNELVFSGVVLDITRRKTAEQALSEEEAKYRTLVEHSQDGVFIIQGGILVFANRALEELTGYARDAITGRQIADLIAPEDREGVVARLRDQMGGRPVPETSTFSLLHADQRTRIRVKINAGIAAYRGEPATIGTFHDITAECQREEELRKSEQKYRDLAELLPQMVFEIDPQTRITFANHHALAIMGLTKEDILNGVHAISFIDPSQHATVMQNMVKIARGEPVENIEYTAYRKDGSTLPVLIYASAIFDGNRLTGFRGIIVDISAWKSATTALKESEERYRSLAEAAQDLIYIIDRKDNVLYVNSYCLEVLGRNGGDVIGRPRREIFPEPAATRQYESLQRVFTGGMPLRIESGVPIRGHISWQDTHLVPLKSPEGEVTAVLGISRDISQLKQTETALKRSNEKLNLLNSITRHDVANQLTVMQGYIQLAMMKEPDTMIGDFLAKIGKAADTIQRQIAFTRTYQDLGSQAPGWFNLKKVLDQARPEVLALENSCPDLEIFADPMLEKVFSNLFDNALRHGEGVTRITSSCERNRDELIIFFKDNGAGIPLDLKQKIFMKGFGRNTGYGLFLVREILAITSIAIHETGKHGDGAQFEISVPKGGFRLAGSADIPYG